MKQYVLAYHGGKMPETPAEGEKLMQRWRDWMGANEAAMADPGHPVGMSKTISSKGVTDNGGANPISGYSVIKADSMESAIKIAKGCPHLDDGTIEIAEAMEM